MTAVKYLVFIQRAKTYFNILTNLDGAGKYAMDDMVQKHNLNVMDSELNNLIVVQGDGSLVVKSGRPFDADKLLADLQATYPGQFDAASVVAEPLAESTSTTTTSSTTTTTTSTSTTSSS
jgi:hypothetical protein